MAKNVGIASHLVFAPMSDLEVRAFWEWADRLAPPLSLYFKLLLITGPHIDEVATAEWQDFDLESGQWTIRTGNLSVLKLAPISEWCASALLHSCLPRCGPLFISAFSAPDRSIARARRLYRSFREDRNPESRTPLTDIRKNVRCRLITLGVPARNAEIAIGVRSSSRN